MSERNLKLEQSSAYFPLCCKLCFWNHKSTCALRVTTRLSVFHLKRFDIKLTFFFTAHNRTAGFFFALENPHSTHFQQRCCHLFCICCLRIHAVMSTELAWEQHNFLWRENYVLKICIGNFRHNLGQWWVRIVLRVYCSSSTESFSHLVVC